MQNRSNKLSIINNPMVQQQYHAMNHMLSASVHLFLVNNVNMLQILTVSVT